VSAYVGSMKNLKDLKGASAFPVFLRFEEGVAFFIEATVYLEEKSAVVTDRKLSMST